MIWEVSPLGGAASFPHFCQFHTHTMFCDHHHSPIIVFIYLTPSWPPLSSPTSPSNLLSYLVFLARLFCMSPQLPAFLIAMAAPRPEDNVLQHSSLSSVLPPFPDVPWALEYYPPTQNGEINKWNSNAIYWKCLLIKVRELGKRTATCLDRRINLGDIGSIWQGKHRLPEKAHVSEC